MSRAGDRVLALLAAALVSWHAAAARAHPTYITMARAVVDREGTCRVTVQFDLLAFALNDTPERVGNQGMENLLSAPLGERERTLRGAAARFARRFAVLADGQPVEPVHIHFPTADDVTHWKEGGQSILPVVLPVEVETRLPTQIRTIALRFPPLLGEVILTVERPGEDFFTEPVSSGKDSTGLALPFRKP